MTDVFRHVFESRSFKIKLFDCHKKVVTNGLKSASLYCAWGTKALHAKYQLVFVMCWNILDDKCWRSLGRWVAGRSPRVSPPLAPSETCQLGNQVQRNSQGWSPEHDIPQTPTGKINSTTADKMKRHGSCRAWAAFFLLVSALLS